MKSEHDWGETLEQGTEPPTAPRVPQCQLPTAPLGWVKCREQISLLIILCIIVYVTNKSHLSLICIVKCVSVSAWINNTVCKKKVWIISTMYYLL